MADGFEVFGMALDLLRDGVDVAEPALERAGIENRHGTGGFVKRRDPLVQAGRCFMEAATIRGCRMRILVGLLVLCVAAGAGGWAYFRNVGVNPSCLLPEPAAGAPRIGIGTPNTPMPVIYGRLARLNPTANPLRFSTIDTEIELREVHYDGGVFGKQVVPTHGSVKTMKVEGKSIAIRDGDIRGGCIDVKGLGKAIVVFSNSLSPTVTMVLTDAQLSKIR